MKDKKLTTKTYWENIMNDEATNAIYNKKLQEITNANENNNNTQEEYTSYFKNVSKRAKKLQQKQSHPPWTGSKQAKTEYNHELTLSPPCSNNSANNSANAKTDIQNSAFKKNSNWPKRYATS
jgi:hypothetical protein